MRRTLFLFHVTANARPSMFSHKLPHLVSRSVRAKGKPPRFCQMMIMDKQWVTQTATHKCMNCFDLQTDCQNFSFLIPICSDNLLLFYVIFFKKKKRIVWYLESIAAVIVVTLFDTFQSSQNYCIQLCTSVNKIDICEAISGLFLRGLLGLVVCGVWLGLFLTSGLYLNNVYENTRNLTRGNFFFNANFLNLTFPDIF